MPAARLALAVLAALCMGAAAPKPATDLLASALRGPLAKHDRIVFAARNNGTDPHWYANFGYWSEDETKMMYGQGGTRLCALDLRTRKVTVLVDDPKGGIRDPYVHYDGRTILFSWRRGESKHYNLYEIGADGKNLRRITDGPWDDFESCYLPNDEIVFLSSRCKRWVNCWYTQVAIMYRCDRDGKNIRQISGNTEHDNTPAVLPDGRLLYTRWEYVDRSQVEFHHLWVTNPDGTAPMTFYGNLHPGIVMIDSRPIPGTTKVLSIFSPGHGASEHRGPLTIVTPESGPDTRAAATPVKGCPSMVRDPWPLTEDLFLVARKNEILLVDNRSQRFEVIYTDAQEVHEPSPLIARPREPVIPDRAKLKEPSGRFILADAHVGRNMAGVKPGDVRKLLVLESLPKPVNFSGGPNPLTYLGTFTLERVVGTVPVEPDGSAYFEMPANRQFILVSLDEKDLSIKRMQSWIGVMPGETTGCVGCHEQRSQTPPVRSTLQALRRPPSRIQPFEGYPDVIDYPRDIQPILDEHCVRCHSYEKPEGRVVLSGDHGPEFSTSYWTLIYGGLVSDGRNGYGNRPPRSIGSAASPLLKLVDGSHYGAKASPRQWRLLWMWIESGATYSGTYACLGNGMAHVPLFPNLEEPGPNRPSHLEVLERRCFSCHALPLGHKVPPGKVSLPAIPAPKPPGSAAYERIVVPNDPMVRRSTQSLYNLTRPEKSFLLLAPLAKEAGGHAACRIVNPDGTFGASAPTFKGTDDPDYQRLLGLVRRSADHLAQIKRFDMPGFRPNAQYIREMKRYGILPAAFNAASDPIDPYATDRAYWQSLWWTPGQ